MTWNSLYRVKLKFAIARSTDYWIASCWFWLHAEKRLVVQAAEKLAFGRVLKGHGFQLAEKLPFEGFASGHDLKRAAKSCGFLIPSVRTGVLAKRRLCAFPASSAARVFHLTAYSQPFNSFAAANQLRNVATLRRSIRPASRSIFSDSLPRCSSPVGMNRCCRDNCRLQAKLLPGNCLPLAGNATEIPPMAGRLWQTSCFSQKH